VSCVKWITLKVRVLLYSIFVRIHAPLQKSDSFDKSARQSGTGKVYEHESCKVTGKPIVFVVTYRAVS